MGHMEPRFLLVGLQPSASSQVPRGFHRARALNTQSSAGGWGARRGLPPSLNPMSRSRGPGPPVEGRPQQVSLQKRRAGGAAVSSGPSPYLPQCPREMIKPTRKPSRCPRLRVVCKEWKSLGGRGDAYRGCVRVTSSARRGCVMAFFTVE